MESLKDKITEQEIEWAAENELLLRDMTDAFIDWRSQCGTGGWKEIPKEWMRDFFKKYLVRSIKINSQSKSEK